MTTTPVWFITGCSTGLGRATAQRAVERGFRVIATARNAGSLADLAGGAADRFLALELDVTRSDQIKAAVGDAVAKFGRIDGADRRLTFPVVVSCVSPINFQPWTRLCAQPTNS